ncbi:hypothetical protein NHE_0225 [Neorickettsia helminthoeca str. Oregon]|uniref:Uncharacterized protein n=1 Tax=Neorickettsia helminthoeca str. Oregon TaxID=1286528 RepID=X5HJD8_9RICK|nr:hypothetical protein NHE_0225 [Neorickettsia helminthoeca str. Oregon]
MESLFHPGYFCLAAHKKAQNTKLNRKYIVLIKKSSGKMITFAL